METIRTALVTGATGAIGSAIARLIAAKQGYRVVILARDEARAVKTTERLKKESGNPGISFVLADLSRHEEIASVAAKWEGPLHILVNNAGATPRRREETPEGIEMQWATNVLGYFWMINYFTPHLAASAPSRIVNVASYWAGGLDLDDPEFRQKHYDNDAAYRQSKQADRMLTAAFAERLGPQRITVNACHPGDVRSTLASNLGYGGHETPEQGAATPVWLATSHETESISGKYFEHKRVVTCPFAADRQKTERLYALCETYSPD